MGKHEKHQRINTHIVSLQRTGSKSLYNAIHEVIDNPLQYYAPPFTREGPIRDTSLGEFFHCWSHTGYKFGPAARFPFDPEADIHFRGQENFPLNENLTSSFDVVPRLDGTIGYERCDYRPQLTVKDVNRRIALLQQVRDTRNFVIKTQLASLVEDLMINPLNEPSEFGALSIAMNGLFDLTIAIIPDDPVRWLCSNYLCDISGVFVPGASQRKAADYYIDNPVTIPTYYIKLLTSRLSLHNSLVSKLPMAVVLKTTNLSDQKTNRMLNGLLDSKNVMVKYKQEFSSFNYEKMIVNFDEVVGAF
jgi:hypothetical protein